jgi:hypothetical protein
MVNIVEITTWADVAGFCVWTLAVCALAKALFGSFIAAEVHYRLALRDQPKRQRLSRLNWEIANRSQWDAEVARGSQHAAAVPLSDADVATRRVELQRLSKSSLLWRAGQYLLGCWACQTFWTAVLIYALTVGVSDAGAWFFSAAAYSGAAVMLAALPGLTPTPRSEGASARGGCKGCGK